MMPSVPSEPTSSRGQVVAGGRLARALRRLHHRAVGHHGGEVRDVLAHGAVAHRVGAGGARRGHAADGGLLGARIDGKEQAQVAQVVVELLARDAGLHHAIEIALVDGEHPVHAREVDREAAERGVDVALERGAGAERDDGDAVRARDATISRTSSAVSTQITASGGWLGIQVMVLACWRRIASPVCSRSPKRCRSIAMAVATSPRGLGVAAGMAIASDPAFCGFPALDGLAARCYGGGGHVPSRADRTMFTTSCSDVTEASIAAQRTRLDLSPSPNSCAASRGGRGRGEEQ